MAVQIETTEPAVASAPTLGMRWASIITTHRWKVLAIWVVLLVACAAAYTHLEARLSAPDFTADHAESTEVDRLIGEHFPQVGAEQDAIVFSSATQPIDSAAGRVVVDRAVAAARGLDHVAGVVGPFDGNPALQLSADRRSAFAIVGINGGPSDRSSVAKRLQSVADGAAGDGIDINIVGYSSIQNATLAVETTDITTAEAIGLPVALILLILALGALVAAVVPVAVAIGGILLGIGALFVLTTMLTLPSLVISIATMLGTGIGIDYAMFIVSRFREELTRRGVKRRDELKPIAEALGVALQTAGKTIVASGLIVMISLCALVVVQAPIFRAIAIGVSIAVACTLVVALTLLPALLAALGPAIDKGALPTRFQPAETRSVGPNEGGWARWARTVMKRPIAFGGAAAVLLVLAALPLTGIRYGIDQGISTLADTPVGRGLAVIDRDFEPGLLSPIEIFVSGPGDTALDANASAEAERFRTDLSHNELINTAFPQRNDGRIMITAVAKVSYDSTEASGLVDDIRRQADEIETRGGPSIQVGGATAEFVDLSHEITEKFPIVLVVVLSISLLFLIVVFRSLLLPLKAIAMNLLATGAALGITVAIFQWGYGETLLNFESAGFLQVFLPIMVFAVLFGLSMDYEVFLIRRMKESWDTSRNNEDAVADGIARTARPITAAAAIMVVVFGSFATADVLELKEMGVAMAVAIAIDAIVIRLVMVPALMRLFGRWNWWFPKR
jgi:putative drug exporter of the RND superfamily